MATRNGVIILTATPKSTKKGGELFLLFHSNNSCKNPPKCYVIRTLHILLCMCTLCNSNSQNWQPFWRPNILLLLTAVRWCNLPILFLTSTSHSTFCLTNTYTHTHTNFLSYIIKLRNYAILFSELKRTSITKFGSSRWAEKNKCALSIGWQIWTWRNMFVSYSVNRLFWQIRTMVKAQVIG